MGLLLLVGGLAILPLFAAFEAHVVNVTARIENALNVPIKSLDFGTVFPQEKLDQNFTVVLSQSFRDEDRVDDVEYVIRQKPKCQAIDLANPAPFAQVGEDADGEWLCPDGYEPMPLLCPYLSKAEVSPDGNGENDMRVRGPIPPFHGPIALDEWTMQTVQSFETDGRLDKSEQDVEDEWLIDLKVPCFGGHCAQDWESFVLEYNASATPSAYIQPVENEHKVFGCDLWLEARGISLPGFGCKDEIDLMLVLDKSGSISGGEITALRNAAKSFVDAVAPSADTAHVGISSFATLGVLDQHLSADTATIKTAIDNLVFGGFTNLKEGIDLAKAELDNPGDGHDRPDGDSPDFMVIISDGSPNEPGTEAEAKAAGIAAADAAKAAGIEIFVVGVGTVPEATIYLRDSIASGADHYFEVTDFASLGDLLKDLASCPADGG